MWMVSSSTSFSQSDPQDLCFRSVSDSDLQLGEVKFSYGYGGTAKVRPMIWKWCGYGFITNHIDVNHIFLLHCKSLPFLDFREPSLPRLRRQVWRRRCHWMLSRSQHGSGQLIAKIRFIIVFLFLNSYWMQLLQHIEEQSKQ